MNEMVERVARALAKEEGYAYDPFPYDARARAAIEAMREVPAICYDNYDLGKVWRQANSTEVWNAWIDAALRPTSNNPTPSRT